MAKTPGLNHTLSQPLKPLKESERRVGVVPAGDGSAGVVTTSVDIFAVLGAKGLIILRRPQRDRGTGSLKNTLAMSKSLFLSYICVIIRQVSSFHSSRVVSGSSKAVSCNSVVGRGEYS